MQEKDVIEVEERLSDQALLDEVNSIRLRANYFRKSGVGILVLVCGLLLFGGYVFFAANEITVNEISFANKANLELLKANNEAQIKIREAELENYKELIDVQRAQSRELENVLKDSKNQIELLKEKIDLLEKQKELKGQE